MISDGISQPFCGLAPLLRKGHKDPAEVSFTASLVQIAGTATAVVSGAVAPHAVVAMPRGFRLWHKDKVRARMFLEPKGHARIMDAAACFPGEVLPLHGLYRRSGLSAAGFLIALSGASALGLIGKAHPQARTTILRDPDVHDHGHHTPHGRAPLDKGLAWVMITGGSLPDAPRKARAAMLELHERAPHTFPMHEGRIALPPMPAPLPSGYLMPALGLTAAIVRRALHNPLACTGFDTLNELVRVACHKAPNLPAWDKARSPVRSATEALCHRGNRVRLAQEVMRAHVINYACEGEHSPDARGDEVLSLGSIDGDGHFRHTAYRAR